MHESFALSWPDLVSHWCLGVEPAFSEEIAREAIEALERHWPERLDVAENTLARGIGILAPLVAVGLTLARTQALVGFDPVIRRLRRGEASALSELEVAAALFWLGLAPVLEPPLGEKVLDASFAFGGRTHFVEVISPDRSEAIVEAQNLIVAIGQQLLAANAGMDIEVLLHPSMDVSLVAALVDLVTKKEPTPEVEIADGLASILKPGPATSGVISPRIENRTPGPALGFAQVSHAPDAIGAVTVRMPIDDQRAQRILSGELDHFSKDVPNVLVMDVTRVIGGISTWTSLISRCFQPTRNRRLGAVVLYSKGIVGQRAVPWERWKVIPNPHAYVPLSSELLAKLAALDQGKTPPE